MSRGQRTALLVIVTAAVIWTAVDWWITRENRDYSWVRLPAQHEKAPPSR